MNIDNMTTIYAVMASATGTTQPVATVFFHDVPHDTKEGFEEYPGGRQITALNSTTEVTILSSPAKTAITRQVDGLAILNRSTDTEIITVGTYDGTTRSPMVVKQLQPNQSIVFTPDGGWQIV